jgi:hypothetical protein
MQQDSYVHQKCGVSQACGLHCNQLGNIQSVRRVSEEPFIVYMCQVVKLADTAGSASGSAEYNFLTTLRYGRQFEHSSRPMVGTPQSAHWR